MTIGQFIVSVALIWVLACFTAITAYALWSHFGGRLKSARTRGVAESSAPARFGGSSHSNFNLDSYPQVDFAEVERKILFYERSR